jgi:hypothetical protein
MTADERLALIRIKAERANKHFRELETELTAFRKSKPYKVGAKRDPKTRKPIYYLIGVNETPANLSPIIGDILQCTKSTLDHLAYQLLLIGKPAGFDPEWVFFPVGEDSHGFKSLLGRIKENGMGQSAIDAIADIEAYKGGKGALLWTLHHLNNIDKHRTILTTFVQTGGVDITPTIGLDLEPWAKELVARLGPVFLQEVGPKPPAKAGDVLYIGAVDEEMHEKRKFTFDVAFAEPGVVEGKPIGPTLHEMANFVDGIVTAFRRGGHLG